MTDLADEMIVARSIEITVQSKIAECFPWRFIRVDGLASVGRHGREVVPHGGGGHHRDPGHGAVAQFSSFLKNKNMGDK